MVSIKGLKKCEVLAYLYNNARVQGMGFLQAKMGDMTNNEAETILNKQTDFDYLYGRVMKIDLSSNDEFNERLYDRDNGEGKAQAIIDALRNRK